jgi:hypothetical protein
MEKDFWTTICEELGYRFFTGIPFVEATPLYKGMNPDMMHYIPAAHEDVAIKLATGTSISGFNSAVLLDIDKIKKVSLDFNEKYSVPLLFITNKAEKIKGLYVTDDLEKAVTYIEDKGKSAVFALG